MIKVILHRFSFALPFLLVLMLFADELGVARSSDFEIPNGMELRVQFWVNVFTRYSINQVIIHDSDNPELIYRVVNLESVNRARSKTEITQLVRKEKADVRQLLLKLASRPVDPNKMGSEEKRYWLLWGKPTNPRVFTRAAERLRVQGGMKEAFTEGVIRSGRYLPVIRQVLAREGLPLELAYLCHVESSFHPGARSKSSAVGMWQMTKGTGRYYMTINAGVDERLDPILSTLAAAKLLKENYSVLQSWPLAVTAYNHGLGGMKRAKTSLGTTDMKRIIDRYQSRSFGFASKNFYAEFLAAVQVAENSETYFGQLQPEAPVDFKVSPLSKSMSLSEISRLYHIKEQTVVALNPAFLQSVRTGKVKVHQGYRLRLPVGHDIPSQFIALAPSEYETKPTPFPDKSQLQMTSHSTVQSNLATAQPPVLETSEADQESESSSRVVEEAQDSELAPENYGQILEQQYAWQTLQFDAFCENLDVERGRIVVQPDETLGHYADWLGVSTQSLRRLNGLRFGQSIYIGQRIRLSFKKVDEQSFYQRRVAYHRGLADQYFQNYRVTQSVEHRIEKGESLWSLVNQRFDVPMWLVMAYNAWETPRKLAPGDSIRVPLVVRLPPSS